jgi:biotin synthase
MRSDRDPSPADVDWTGVADRSLAGQCPTRAEALAALRAPDEQTLELLAAAYRLRARHFRRDVHLHVLMNTGADPCSEDCHFCAQSGHAAGRPAPPPPPSGQEMVAAARRAKEAGAWRFCMVATGRRPDARRFEEVCSAVSEIRGILGLRVCVSMGLLEAGQAEALLAAGADRYNHNLETGPNHFLNVCTTHRYEDRVRTVELARESGLEVCCGGIVGLGESDDDVVDLAFELRRLGVASIPINVLDPRPGTALAGSGRLDPQHCLRVLCMFRLVLPDRDLRIAAGRETALRSLQPLSLFVCSSMFIQGYLTTDGREIEADMAMLRDLGFTARQNGGEAADPRTGGS